MNKLLENNFQLEKIKFSIRLKFFSILVILNIILAISITYTIYNSAFKIFFETYLNNKLSLAKIAAKNVNGEKHKYWTSSSAIRDPEFLTYRKNLKNILELAENAKYLYTLNYNYSNETFLYSATGGVVEEDTFWIETNEIAFQLVLDENKNFKILYNENIISDEIEIPSLTNIKYKFKIINDVEYSNIYINDRYFLGSSKKVRNKVKLESREINSSVEKLFYTNMMVNNLNIKFQFFYTEKNDFDTLPGAVFTNSPEYFITMKRLIKENRDEVDNSINPNVYGRYYSARAVIRDSNNLPVGLACLEISEKEIINFKETVQKKLLFVSAGSFILVFMILFFLTTLITKPIQILTSSASEFANGNLNHRIKIFSKDEFQNLAYSLNTMAEKILDSNSKIENYALNLEKLIDERTNQITVEKEKSDKLLLNILPKKIANELKEKGEVLPVQYDSVSVLFTDFVGFTRIATKMLPSELIERLNHIFLQFDLICTRRGIEKLKTIGDSYMCAGGLTNINSTHPIDICLAALEMKNFINETANILKSISDQNFWEIRIGIHTGPIIAGVVGKTKFAFDIWGDTVNIASRMESNSIPGKINISDYTYNLIKDFFECEERGFHEIKNHGKIKMYFLKRILPELSKDEDGLIPNKKFYEVFIKF